MTAQCTNSKTLAAGRFLSLELLEYRDDDSEGVTHQWEAVQRRGGTGTAVIIIAFLRPVGHLLLVRQFRPPLNAYALELPAGLIDPGEDVLTAACRELLEETGYHGTACWQTGLCSSSAGLTGECVTTVFMNIDAEAPENRLHQQHLQDNEEIELITAPLHCLHEIFTQSIARGDILDSRLAAWAVGRGVRW